MPWQVNENYDTWHCNMTRLQGQGIFATIWFIHHAMFLHIYNYICTYVHHYYPKTLTLQISMNKSLWQLLSTDFINSSVLAVGLLYLVLSQWCHIWQVYICSCIYTYIFVKNLQMTLHSLHHMVKKTGKVTNRIIFSRSHWTFYKMASHPKKLHIFSTATESLKATCLTL